MSVLRERAGDLAATYHLYSDAAGYYQEALNVTKLSSIDRDRISSKIGWALYLRGDHKAASVWFKRRLAMCLSDPQDAQRSVDALFQIGQQMSVSCKGEAVLSAMTSAMQIAEKSRDAELIEVARLGMAGALQYLGRYEEGVEILRGIDITHGNARMLIANAAAAAGNAGLTYEHCEAFLEIAEADGSPYIIAKVLQRYGNLAKELGDSLRAKACYERALLFARQSGVTWLAAVLCLHYAQLLACMGQPSAAHPHLLEALSTDWSIPYLDMYRASVGIPLALQVQDETVLAHCAHPKVIEVAFESENPELIGGVARAFAQLYAFRGHPRAAGALLHRALEKISHARFNLDLLIAIGQHGALKDTPRARALLKARAALPHAALFEAGLTLFDAFVAQRRGSAAQARTCARDAAARFDALQWQGYAEQVRGIDPGTENVPVGRREESKPFSHMRPALTARESEVALLVLRGLTNREIAGELAIAPHTVEKHVHSIMSRLGVRSRHQVAGVLEFSPGQATF